MNSNDIQYLRYLRIGHFINAGLLFLIALFPVIHLGVGIAMVAGMFESENDPPPVFLGYLFVGIALVIIAMFATLGVLNLIAARNLGEYRNWIFCVVMAAVNIMFSPIGLVIGIFSLVVLLRESVKQLFEHGGQPRTGQMPDWR
ncbi:hypothetical protein [Leptolyngbya sp. 7M]|uniref:hypothetical protein n=1 Tax=Leptolyngbya sp. 7M TaxID=2812896 RepID=UPI001B8D747B|nr:hypothetical protein [Leptolyngbya sp. 7M]QYO66389.1 hypothetical protein JVX88_06200 [Leptolyngbya sp. 7M]